MSAARSRPSLITRDGVCRALAPRGVLPYGEVRIGPGEIVIGAESLTDLPPAQRRLYEHAIAAAGVEPESVLVVRISESSIEVDAIDTDVDHWPVRTQRVDPGKI